MASKQGFDLTSQQATLIYGALLLRPTVEAQLQMLIEVDSSWASRKEPLKQHYERLTAIYIEFAPKGSKPWPPPFLLGTTPKLEASA